MFYKAVEIEKMREMFNKHKPVGRDSHKLSICNKWDQFFNSPAKNDSIYTEKTL